MLYAGLDLSRQRLDVRILDEVGRTVEVTAARPDADGLRSLAARIGRYGEPIEAAIESMNGARFVHDTLERAGWDVAIADAVRAKGLAPLVAKTDKIDAWVLAELARRELVPEIWLPDPASARSASGLASGCTSSATGRPSRTASTPRSSPSAIRSRCPISSEPGAGAVARAILPNVAGVERAKRAGGSPLTAARSPPSRSAHVGAPHDLLGRRHPVEQEEPSPIVCEPACQRAEGSSLGAHLDV